MKKILLGALIIAGMAVNAQITSGQLFVGGSIGFSTQGSSDEKTTGSTTTKTTTTTDGVSRFSYNIMPQVGFMITENIGAGLGIGYDFEKTTTPDGLSNATGTDKFEQVEKTGTFAIAPFARYYKGVTEKFYLYGELSVPFAMSNTKKLMMNEDKDGTTDDDGVFKSSEFGVGLGLGANYFVSSNIALEVKFNLFNISYTSIKRTEEDKDGNGKVEKNSYFNMGFDTDKVFKTGNLSVGVKFFF